MLPEGLTIKGHRFLRIHCVHDDCWSIEDGHERLLKDGTRWAHWSEWSDTRDGFLSADEAENFACEKADLPKIDGRQPAIVRVDPEGYVITDRNEKMLCFGQWRGYGLPPDVHETARAAYVAIQKAHREHSAGGDGACPELAPLSQDAPPAVSEQVICSGRFTGGPRDFRVVKRREYFYVESREKESEPWKPEFQPDGAGELNLSTLIKTCLSAPSAPAAERGSWRPIVTAPMDGTELLLHGVDVHNKHRKGPFIGSYSGDRPGSDCRYWRCITPGLISEIAPTHWMPLPTPPDEERT